MLRTLPVAEPEAFVARATKRRVVGWCMAENFEIALPDRVEVREVDVEADAVDEQGEPVFESVFVDHADGTRTKERRRKRETKRVTERVVLSHGGTVAGPCGAFLVRDVADPNGWHVLGARCLGNGVWRLDAEPPVILLAEIEAAAAVEA